MGRRPGKGAVPANAHLPEVLLLVLCYRRSYGLSRRSAPRNGRGRACPRTHAFTFRAPRSLAPADPCLSSACHCEQRSCNRRHPANFCMSLRTSAHTGVAIRVPAEKRDKLVAVGANSQLFRIRLKCCFLSCSTARRSGLPRRFAPRNDMQRTVTRTHSKYVSRHSPGSARVLRRHPANFCMSLRASAHTGVAIRSPCGGTWQIAALKANS